jgi:hypothetical protein
MHAKFYFESLKGRDSLEDSGIDGRIILNWILGEIGLDDVDWIYLSQDRNHWRAVVNSVMRLVSIKCVDSD